MGSIIRDISLLRCHWQIYDSTGRVKGEDKNMADAASSLNHLSDWLFFHHFNLTFPPKNPWRLTPLPSGFKPQLTSILYNKRSLKDFHPHYSKKTPPPGSNGANFSVGSKSNSNYRKYPIPYTSSISFPRASTPVFCHQEAGPSRRRLWDSTFGLSAKYLKFWGPANPAKTSWANSNFSWAYGL